MEGLAYVFPSFDPARPQCRANPNTDRSFGVETSWVCTERALGREVLISYDHVSDIDEVDAHVRHVMQRALDELATQRRLPVLG